MTSPPFCCCIVWILPFTRTALPTYPERRCAPVLVKRNHPGRRVPLFADVPDVPEPPERLVLRDADELPDVPDVPTADDEFDVEGPLDDEVPDAVEGVCGIRSSANTSGWSDA